jgi:4-nitrophenyl phosphatase
MLSFATLRAVIFDMDGVLWRGDQALPGLAPLFAFLRARGIACALATNNSYRVPSYYVTKLAGMGVPDFPASHIVTSSTATADYMAQQYPQGTRVYVVGGDGIRQALADVGMVLCDDTADAVQVVVAGIDPYMTYDKLKRATLLIRGGAQFVGTNGDRTYPTPEGLVPGAGSILAAIETATDVAPTVIGKPEAPMMHSALHILGTAAAHTLMIGDRLETDILGAANVGMPTALVLSGVATAADAACSTPPPTAIYADIAALHQAWAQVGDDLTTTH